MTCQCHTRTQTQILLFVFFALRMCQNAQKKRSFMLQPKKVRLTQLCQFEAGCKPCYTWNLDTPRPSRSSRCPQSINYKVQWMRPSSRKGSLCFTPGKPRKKLHARIDGWKTAWNKRLSFKETRDDSRMIAFLKFFFFGGGWTWIHKGFYQ